MSSSAVFWLFFFIAYFGVGLRIVFIGLPIAREAGHSKSGRVIGTLFCLFLWPIFTIAASIIALSNRKD